MTIILDIVNDITYKQLNFYYKNLYIMNYTKITKSNKICSFETIHSQIYMFLFSCVAQDTNYLNRIFYIFVG
jgi:hypothetical protein